MRGNEEGERGGGRYIGLIHYAFLTYYSILLFLVFSPILLYRTVIIPSFS